MLLPIIFYEMVKLLIKSKVNINRVDDHGSTALMMQHYLNAHRLLIKLGVNVNT